MWGRNSGKELYLPADDSISSAEVKILYTVKENPLLFSMLYTRPEGMSHICED